MCLKINYFIANKLAKYFIETKTLAVPNGSPSSRATSTILEFKIRKFAGKYERIMNKHIELILFNFKNHKRKADQDELIYNLEHVCKREYISPLEIVEIVQQSGINLDLKIL